MLDPRLGGGALLDLYVCLHSTSFNAQTDVSQGTLPNDLGASQITKRLHTYISDYEYRLRLCSLCTSIHQTKRRCPLA